MDFWRGWGYLSLLYPLAAAAILGILAIIIGGEDASITAYMGAGLVLGSAFAARNGYYANVKIPRAALAVWEAEERQRLGRLARRGKLSYGGMSPNTDQETADMIDRMVADGLVKHKKPSEHLLFGIPMQWASLIIALIGAVMVVLGGFGSQP